MRAATAAGEAKKVGSTILLALAVAGPADAREPVADCRLKLREVAAESGLVFVHDRGTSGAKHLPETMGGGLAWIDYDGDGWLDLYAVQSGPYPPPAGQSPERAANRLFRNRGDGTFEEVLGTAAHRGCGQGALAADFDGDGDTDLYVTNIGPDALLLNQGDGGFEEGAVGRGLGLGGWSSSAALADGDGDGDLDLYVSRYLDYDPEHGLFCGDPESGELEYCDPSLFRGASDAYYENRGGVFQEASVRAGIAPAAGRGLGVVWTDLDGDLDPDLYVANDLDVNFLFANRGGRFEDLSVLSGAAVNREGKAEAGMGLAVADVDGDLAPDLAVTNFDVETNTLYRNLGGLFFSDDSAVSGFGLPSFNRLAFGLLAADLDRDGAVDFYVANGHIFERPKRENVSYRQPDQVLLGDGRGHFREPGCSWLAADPSVARGAAAGDFDNDGDVDVAVQENGGPLRLLANETPAAGWLGVALRGQGANREAIGARVTVTMEGGVQARWALAGESYQSSSDRRALFGLGDSAPLELEVLWPSGRRLRLASPVVGRYLRLYEAQPFP